LGLLKLLSQRHRGCSIRVLIEGFHKNYSRKKSSSF
jgi:hypothetical protein